MRLENAVAADVLERILSAYGFTMQKELSDKLGIAKSNVASWLQRGQVPGNVLVQCALDTGADVQWLVTGVFANANILKTKPLHQTLEISGKRLVSKMLSSGGKPVLQRIMAAYGHSTQKELSEYLGISTGTISTWIRREYFPGDVVITCALDTGASLEWLALGCDISSPEIFEKKINLTEIPKLTIISGVVKTIGKWSIDLTFLPYKLSIPNLLYSTSCSWLIDMGITEISNGRWLLGIDGKHDIYDVTVLPGKKISVTSTVYNFTCGLDEVSAIGKVAFTMEYNF